jgi:hypothetical protein
VDKVKEKKFKKSENFKNQDLNEQLPLLLNQPQPRPPQPLQPSQPGQPGQPGTIVSPPVQGTIGIMKNCLS